MALEGRGGGKQTTKKGRRQVCAGWAEGKEAKDAAGGGGSHLLHVVGHLLHRAEGALRGRQHVEESAELLPRRGRPRAARLAAHRPAPRLQLR